MDEINGTALMYASCKGYLDIVKLLIDTGADVNAVMEDGDSSYYY